MKICNCYMFTFANYRCESWTWNRALRMEVNVFDIIMVLQKDIENKVGKLSN
jgi:hypothetical protein